VLRQVLDEDKCYCFDYGVALLRYESSCGIDIDIDFDFYVCICVYACICISASGQAAFTSSEVGTRAGLFGWTVQFV
jgi:hypothetical protein